MYEYELSAYDLGYKIICGVDEAGRGPLAGAVYAAAVILPPGLEIEGVNDSKKLSPKKRDALFDVITERAAAWCVATASVEEIDSVNILQATFLAMRRAVNGLCAKPDLILVDGDRDPIIDAIQTRTIIGGDGKSASIAAASILAKVSRDRYMVKLDEEYPQYRFAQHKGYGTRLHYEMLEQYGISPVHRRSFLRKWRKSQAEMGGFNDYDELKGYDR